MKEQWDRYWYQDVTIQIHIEDLWKCFPMTLRVRPFWHGCVGLRDLSAQPARQLQLHGTKAEAVWSVQSVITKHP